MSLPYLDSHAEADLREAIRRTNAEPVDHISPDTCGVCGGEGCDQCLDCRCSRCDPYVPEYVRTSVKRWRPAS